MANIQESSPFFSRRDAESAMDFLYVFICMKEHRVFSLRPRRLCESKYLYIQAVMSVRFRG